MRVLVCLVVAGCSTTHGYSAHFVDPTDGAQVTPPAVWGPVAAIQVAFDSMVSGPYLEVTDEAGNNFTSLTDDAYQLSPANALLKRYPLPAGRNLTAEAGFTSSETGVRESLASVTFTMSEDDPCQTTAAMTSASITSPTEGQVVSNGPIDIAATLSPSTSNTYVYVWYSDNGQHMGFAAAPQMILPAGTTFTAEAGVYCDNDQQIWEFYPLAAVRFSTSP